MMANKQGCNYFKVVKSWQLVESCQVLTDIALNLTHSYYGNYQRSIQIFAELDCNNIFMVQLNQCEQNEYSTAAENTDLKHYAYLSILAYQYSTSPALR